MRSVLTRLGILATISLTGSPVLAQAPAAISGLRLEPTSGGAQLTLAMNSTDVDWTDFALQSPDRVVIDVQGARNRLPDERFDAVDRGGISGIRTSQFTEDVVRVVVDLREPSNYTVSRVPEGIQVTFPTTQTGFAPWGTASAGARTAETAPPAATPAAPPAVVLPRGSLTQEQQRITVTFQEVDIRDVLASFAEYTGRSIVPGSGVEGVVTAEIKDQPWDVALAAILNAYGFAAQELPSGIIQVDAIANMQERRTQEALTTQTFRINYVPVEELAVSLGPLMSERGALSSNPSTNTLIATDVGAVIDNIAEMVSQLDVRTPQVAIQAKIIFVNRTDVEELGITYDLKDSEGNSLNRLVSVPDPANPGEFTDQDLVLLGGNSIAALGNANARVQGPALETVISLVLGRFTLITFIDALQSAELSDVQAAPLITTLDNQQAEIWVGERTPIRVVDVGTPAAGAGGATAPRATAQLVETGIRLRVTPHITADRHILMELHAERSSAQLAATDIGVVFQQQQGNTRLMVEDGETAVIGGLTVTEVGSTRAGIPFLMDLPIIGPLFRTTRTREQKRDLLIMVTPHIVN
ncbi:MAG TPA: AMIN domain-containing protein [Longimicrobiaceae bacterium]|nr:AMIN domain-containing protein [Longimicrobiaceae bacterium]